MAYSDNLTLEELTEIVNSQIKKLINEKKENEKKKGNKYTIEMIAKDLDTTKQSIFNYTNGGMPKYEQLVKIRNYFNAPFSYIFGETIGKEKSNIELARELKLSDEAINILKSPTNTKTLPRIFMINCLLENPNILDTMGRLFIEKLSLKRKLCKNEDLSKLKDIPPIQLYNYKLFMLINKLDTLFDDLMNSENIPEPIIYQADKTALMDYRKTQQYSEIFLNDDK